MLPNPPPKNHKISSAFSYNFISALTTITVEGLSLNEEKYRGEFSYEIWGEVSITYKNESITLSELQKGDLVSVILVVKQGHIAGINDIWKITLIR